jgi:hypothetical protein
LATASTPGGAAPTASGSTRPGPAERTGTRSASPTAEATFRVSRARGRSVGCIPVRRRTAGRASSSHAAYASCQRPGINTTGVRSTNPNPAEAPGLEPSPCESNCPAPASPSEARSLRPAPVPPSSSTRSAVVEAVVSAVVIAAALSGTSDRASGAAPSLTRSAARNGPRPSRSGWPTSSSPQQMNPTRGSRTATVSKPELCSAAKQLTGKR